MKITLLFALSFVLLQSCNNVPKAKEKESGNPEKEKKVFFPVSDYLKGQLFEISNKGLTPVKYVTIHDHTDSTWLKPQDFKEAFKEFFRTEIDSTNLTAFFTETRFLDQTINAFTFSYDAIGQLPDTLTLKHWDVYVNPETGKVKRVYLVKNNGTGKTLQLTWIGDRSCKIITIAEEPNGNSYIEKEEKINWDFNTP